MTEQYAESDLAETDPAETDPAESDLDGAEDLADELDLDACTGDDISSVHADDEGIPDEPEAFVEEIRASAELPETGDPRVDEILGGLVGIEHLPTTEHVAVYDQVHRGLQDALANLDQG